MVYLSYEGVGPEVSGFACFFYSRSILLCQNESPGGGGTCGSCGYPGHSNADCPNGQNAIGRAIDKVDRMIWDATGIGAGDALLGGALVGMASGAEIHHLNNVADRDASLITHQVEAARSADAHVYASDAIVSKALVDMKADLAGRGIDIDKIIVSTPAGSEGKLVSGKAGKYNSSYHLTNETYPVLIILSDGTYLKETMTAENTHVKSKNESEKQAAVRELGARVLAALGK